ncbi:Bax inhibitor-1/YccA family protein [Candidatus Gracilibacteria bacterium]|nr:Bax inhibitor-1/YccA family protein [Candidatus Gracilibacteria bacterium]
MTRVYAWMTAGLMTTGAIAGWTANTPALLNVIYGTPFVLFGLFIAQIALVVWLSARVHKMAVAQATGLFLAYSALNGLTLASIFIVYTSASIASTFFITAGMFAGISLYGYTTKQDLSKVGSIAIMALIGILVASLVNWFLRSEALYWVITYAGVLIFVALTAWDTQKIKQIAAQAQTDEDIQRVAIIGALTLYLDFINLFLFLLRIFGRRN